MSRLFLGQFFPITDALGVWYEEAREFEREAKALLFPELVPNQFYGIYNKQTGENAKIAYDIIQVVRQQLAWNRIGKDPSVDKRVWPNMLAVSYDDPMQVSAEPLPTMKLVPDKTDVWELYFTKPQHDVWVEYHDLYKAIEAGRFEYLADSLHISDELREKFLNLFKKFKKSQ